MPIKTNLKIYYFTASIFVQIGLAHTHLNIEDGFKFHFLVKCDYYQVFINGQFLRGGVHDFLIINL